MTTPRRKVLFVITKSNWGGAQRYVYDIATSLPKEEFEVAVAFGGTGEAGARTGSLAQRLQEARVRTIFIPSFTRDIFFFREFKTLAELVRVIKQEQPDVLHLSSSKAGGLGALAGRIAGVKNIIFTAHGFAHKEPRPLYQRALIWIASWLTILLAHRTVVLSLFELRHAPALLLRHKLVNIYNGIDFSTQFGSGDQIRKAFPPNVRITGTIGELTKNKNQIALVEQAKADPDAYIAIVGEGEERAHLEKKIQEYRLENRVKLFGFLPAAEVLRGFDAFALPSLKEGLPYVLLEARAAGLPIVANRVGGVSEILDGNRDFTLERMIKETTALYRYPPRYS